MEAIKINIVQVSIAGRNVTADVTPYLSRVSYTDKEEAESDDVGLTFEDKDGHWQNGWYPHQGDLLRVVMGNSDNSLDCGVFEIDEIELDFPPDTVTIKGIGASISKALRTKNSKAFEKQSLKSIAQYFANKHGLKLTGNIRELQKIEIERKTQEKQTDLSFLSDLAKEYGIIFSIHGGHLVFMDTYELEAQPAILIFHRYDISRARFTDKTSQVYCAAIVSTRNMKTNSVKRWKVTPSDKEGEKSTLSNDTYQGASTAENDSQAQVKALAALKNKNKEKITGSITVPGNALLVAGVNICLLEVGAFSGIWHVVSSGHTTDNSGGYVTEASIYKII